ncbi:hypothetical protein VTO42DRAFT_919 [Malbranchea cinnamomea]
MAAEDPGRPRAIAIIGMSCRLSGNVSTLDDFWTLISRSRDGWCPIPENRFSSKAYYHPNPEKKGCFNLKGGYFMNHDFSKFDAPFFHITNEEAIAMDPQQRQLLECTYEALENAGIPKESVAGRKMGVFVGAKSSDYHLGMLRDLSQVPMFEMSGNHQALQAGRISHYFDLRGPSVAVDTACSSSLYALHLAVQSIRSGDADSAIVAGCSLHLEPDDAVSNSMLGIFNEHGKTFAFDHRAKSGFARGEGTGCLILKSLEQALRDNDKIRSIIVDVGSNHCGKTVGISTPSGDAQEQLIRDVYARAGISPEDTGFVEAHGTGTKVGDPVEAGAIYRVFGPGRTKRSPLYLGSAKTNFGHLENASGIISIIKASLMLERGFILPNANFEKANDTIPLDRWNLKIPTSIRPWPKSKRFISVNNFGFGGSNSHAVLERPPFDLCDLPQESQNEIPRLFVLSANDEAAAKRMATQLGVYIEQHPEVFQKRLVRDMAYTLGERRTRLPWRIALTASSSDELAASLNSVEPARASSIPLKLAFVYSGQGAQWAQMGKELMDSHPEFADTVRTASNYLERLGADFSLLEELSKNKEESKINEAHISQPACTAIQLGLTVLFSSWNIKPNAVIGHSSGEIAAAYATGAIALEDAMAIAYHRGQAVSKLKTKYPKLRGAMLAVGAGTGEFQEIIKPLGLDGIFIACENSPDSITAAGDEAAIDYLAAELVQRGVFHRKLRVDVAYHSPHMQLVAEGYKMAIKDVISKAVTEDVCFYSSLLGAKLEAPMSLGPSYWVKNLTEPVLFSSALQHLYADTRPDVIVEVGPHSTLEGPIKQILKSIGKQAATDADYIPSLIRNQHATSTTLKLAGKLFVNGHALNFSTVNQTKVGQQKPAVISDFAPYPWSHGAYWFESRVGKQHRLKPFARHDLLGLLEDTYNDAEPTWRNILTSDDLPWLKGHKMQSLVTFPLAGYVCMAVEAASQRAKLRGVELQQIAGFRLRDVQVSKALILDDDVKYETLVSFKARSEGTQSSSAAWDEFRVFSWTSSRGWQEHCRGLVCVKRNRTANPVSNTRSTAASARRARAANLASVELSLDKFYTELKALGADYSSVFTFQSNSAFQVHGESYVTCEAVIQDTACAMPASYETPSIVPTAFLDLFLQATFPLLGAGRGAMTCLYMASAIKDIEISSFFPNRPRDKLQIVVNGHPNLANPTPVDFSIDAWDDAHSEPVAKLTGLRMTPVNDGTGERHTPPSLCYKVQWEPFVGKSMVKGDNPAATSEQPGYQSVNREQRVDCNGYHDANAVLVVNTQANSHPNRASQGDNASNGNRVNGAEAITEEHVNGNANQTVENGRSAAIPMGNGPDGRIIGTTGLRDAVIHLISDRDKSDPLISAIVDVVELHTGSKSYLSSFSNLKVSPSTRYICLAELDAPLLHGMSAETFERLKEFLITCTSVLWVTTGAYHIARRPEYAICQGLLRTVRSELAKAAATLDLDPESQLETPDRAKLIIAALEASLFTSEDGSPVEYEFAEEHGKLMVPRLVEQKDMNLAVFHATQPSVPYLQNFQHPSRRLKISVGTYGALDSLYWKDETELPLADNEIEIKVAFTGMNFKDVVVTMGQVASPYIGCECSGTVARVGSNVASFKVGDRVCAMSLGAYGTYARCPATSAVIIPDDMSFEVAASVPVAYCTAYYGIVELAQMEPGEKILIHAASGGVGQAAVQLAQLIGAEIYATVGNADKKQLLIDTYNIPKSQIFFSRDAEFGPAIREATGGVGVDVVLNSLAGDLLRESWECLAPFGRFVEIGKKDITSNSGLEMAKFEHNCTFSSVDLTHVAAWRPGVMARVLSSVMSLLVEKKIKPIMPLMTVGISEVGNTLRKLQGGQTSGKIVVNHLVSEQVMATHPLASAGLLQGEATYLIVGGTGGIGRSITRRLLQHGARHIVLLSRSGKVTNELNQLIKESHKMGASVCTKKCDIADEAAVVTLLAELRETLPPIRGIIHAAMVLRDVLFEKMTFEDYDAVVRSKITGAWNIHSATLDFPLDFFIVLSSVAGIVGNRGQAAYAAANTFLDSLVHYRRRRGLVATSLDLTAVEGVGYLAEDAAKRTQVMKNLSGNAIGEAEVLALVDAALEGKVGTLCGGQCITGLNFDDALALPYYASDGKFSHLRKAALAKSAVANETTSFLSGELTLAQKLQRASSMEEAKEVVTVGLRDRLSTILMLPTELIDSPQAMTSITAAGLNSLNAIELRNWIGRELQAHLQVLELLTGGGVRDLAALVLKKTKLEGVWSRRVQK